MDGGATETGAGGLPRRPRAHLPGTERSKCPSHLRHPIGRQKTWRVQQMLVDPEEHNDWLVEFGVDLGGSRKQGEPALRLRRMGSLT